MYEWINVGVLDYDKETKLYLVHKTNHWGLVRDENGKCILNGGMTEEGGSEAQLLLYYRLQFPNLPWS